MKSIRDVYKIGKGPSSSHTMGPSFAMEAFVKENPENYNSILVTLYNKLSGIYRILGKSKEAMDYFELKYDADNYSKAFKQYRKIWIEENIGLLVVVIVLIFLVPLGIGRIRRIKREIDMADIFKV
jgi:hypothetical protein